MATDFFNQQRKPVVLFMLGFLGVLSSATMLPNLVAMSSEPLPMPVFWLQVIAVVQSAILLLLMVVLGTVLAHRVGLTTPLLDRWLGLASLPINNRKILVSGVVGGTVGGLFIVYFSSFMATYLPADFLQAGQNLSLPWHTRLLYGGITEEILLRWGLMSFFVWGLYKVTQRNAQSIGNHNYVLGIVLAALVFALGHLPSALMLTETPTSAFYWYIIVGNGVFGCIAGWLYWKKGLECAILAHMLAHVTMLILG